MGWVTLTAIGRISVPPWAMVALRRPPRRTAGALANALLLWGALAAGEMLLGWTA